MKILKRIDKKLFFRLMINVLFILFVVFLLYKDISTTIKKQKQDVINLEILYERQDSILNEQTKSFFLLKEQNLSIIEDQKKIKSQLENLCTLIKKENIKRQELAKE